MIHFVIICKKADGVLNTFTYKVIINPLFCQITKRKENIFILLKIVLTNFNFFSM